ncbi:MAG: glycoside hydrolase family 3 C-terminal domain-containing protein [Microbacterium sp.]
MPAPHTHRRSTVKKRRLWLAAAAASSLVAVPLLSMPASYGAVELGGVADDAPWTPTVTWLVSQLTAQEKVSLIAGEMVDPRGQISSVEHDPHGNAGYFPGVPRLGIPEKRHTDALGISVFADTTAPPSRIGVASSFDRELVSELGVLEGLEGIATGVTLLYGPQADLARTPSWSRNNTAYSEDALLASEFMAEEVAAIQSQGLMAQVKHIGAYNGQNQNDPVVVDGQAMHEIYYAAAERAAEIGVSSMMCSYGTFMLTDDPRYTEPLYSCDNDVMIEDTIKGDWGFTGFVTSDYGAVHETSDFLSGVDQGFKGGAPDNYLKSAYLLPLIDPTSATYDEQYADRADEAVARTLYADERFGLLDNDYIPEQFRSDVAQNGDVDSYDNTVSVDKEAGIETSRELAERGAVLLKNENGTLPLSDETTVNVVGQSSNQLPANPGGEKSTGFGDRAVNAPDDALIAIGGEAVSLNPGIDNFGVTVPAEAYLGVDGVSAGAQRTTLSADGVESTTVDASIDGNQADLEKGATYTWETTIEVPADDTYRLLLQHPSGVFSGDDTDYNGGITRANGSSASLTVDGTARSLSNPNSNILDNAIDSVATDPSIQTVADNGQYLGYANRAAELELTAGTHTVRITYAADAELAVDPTMRFAWSAIGADFTAAVEAARVNDVSVVFVDDYGSTGGDGASTTTDVLSLSTRQNDLVSAVAEAAHEAGNRVVVVLNTGSAVQMPWEGQADSILEMWYPGQEGGAATANLLYGKANPGGHLTITFPVDSEHTLFTVVDGKNAERSTLTQDEGESVATLKWTEALSIGYRWFTDPEENTQGWAPLYEFGHGLSYTQFEYSPISAKAAGDGSVSLTFSVTNTGDVAGYDAPQVYVGESGELDEAIDQTPLKLAAFDSVHLEPGETQELSLTVDARTLSSYSMTAGDWVLGTGERTFSLGHSSSDIVSTASAVVRLDAEEPGTPTDPEPSPSPEPSEPTTPVTPPGGGSSDAGSTGGESGDPLASTGGPNLLGVGLLAAAVTALGAGLASRSLRHRRNSS